MTVFNLGSINEDRFYTVPHIPAPGETLSATAHSIGLGGKGANQSVAIARAGGRVIHIGKIGPSGAWACERLEAFGVDVSCVAQDGSVTGHANITVDQAGENMIVVMPGANRELEIEQVEQALIQAKPSDILVLQNETSSVAEAARLGAEKGMFVIYSAAPFEIGAVMEVMGHVDLLVLNEVEAEQLRQTAPELKVPNRLVTKGAAGAVWLQDDTESVSIPAFPADPVDTTGAGDCFIGYVAAGLDEGLEKENAMRLAAAASAIQVTRPGTAEAIPSRDEVEAFLAGIGT